MGKKSRYQAHLSQLPRKDPVNPLLPEVQMPRLNDWTLIHDKSDSREAIYATLSDPVKICPKCRGNLQQLYKSYLIGNYEAQKELESFYMGSKFGWFCDSCPTLIINLPDLHDFLTHLPADLKIGSNAIVLGIINILAIPENKRQLPVGSPKNPIPLCIFTNLPPLPPKTNFFKGEP
jgi:hypothetical protein